MESWISFNYRHQPIAFSSPPNVSTLQSSISSFEIKQQSLRKEKREMTIHAKVEASKEGKKGKWGVEKEVPERDDVTRLMRRLRTEGDEIV